jgi:transcription-repair coupling factor
MDRLVCGDVGFGKTEVALRAAFVALMDGRQVAVLVPTTLLAEQHFQNFSDRFADWPVRIAELSRFRSAKEQRKRCQDWPQARSISSSAPQAAAKRMWYSRIWDWSLSTRNTASECARRSK